MDGPRDDFRNERELRDVIARGLAGGARDPKVPARVVWADAGDEVLVHLDSVEVGLRDGALIVSVDLESDQTGRGTLITAFALGEGEGDGAGWLALTDEQPYGDAVLVAGWGAALQQAIWSALLSMAVEHAAGRGLTPRGIAVRKGRVVLEAGPPLRRRGKR